MKRKILFTLFLLLPLLAVMATENSWRYAKEPVLILKKDSAIKDTSLNEKMFSKGDRFLFGRKESDGSERGFGVDLDDPLTIKIYFRDSNGKGYSSNINDVYLEGNNLKIDTDIKNSHWIPSYYYALLESRNVKSDLLEYESHWKDFENYTSDPDLTWFDCFTVQGFYFDDFYFVYFGKDGYYNNVDFFAYLDEVSDTKIVYDVQKMYSHYLDYKKIPVYDSHPDFIPLYEKEAPFKVILTLDGDYMKMYIDEVSEENLFQILVRTTPEACDQIEKWIKGESDDLSKVVMPRFSSVKKESSPAAPAANISPNKTMTVSENLRLRSEEATTSDILTVLQAGTRVKILEVGKAETIDGISSNWVKVEVQSGAKDRDGKTITKGTVGWCFGGYLRTGEYEGSELFDSQETANETESEVKSIRERYPSKNTTNPYPHEGVDFEASYGTGVYATICGIVLAIKDQKDKHYGYHVLIHSDDGYIFLLGHLSSICVEINQRITPNTLVAKVGNSGNCYTSGHKLTPDERAKQLGAHLHLSVFKGKQIKDIYNAKEDSYTYSEKLVNPFHREHNWKKDIL